MFHVHIVEIGTYLGEERDYKTISLYARLWLFQIVKIKVLHICEIPDKPLGQTRCWTIHAYFKDMHTNERIYANFFCYDDNVIAVTLICFAFHVSCSKGSLRIWVWFPFVLPGMCRAVLNIFHRCMNCTCAIALLLYGRETDCRYMV